MIADVKIYLKEFMFKKKNFVLHRAKLIISAQIVGSNPTVQWSTFANSDNGKYRVSQRKRFFVAPFYMDWISSNTDNL